MRLAATTEFEYGVKQLLSLMAKALTTITTNANMNPNSHTDRSRELLFILCEILSYRLIIYPVPAYSKVMY